MPPADKPSTSTAKRPPVKSLRGVPRAKSGCYTCRIRRKKCDEQPDDQGRCATCVRLRLECLGFGAKRPEWLRESRTVAEIREKIKVFLASQGMVKGYSGTAHQGFSFQDHGQQYYVSATAPSPPSTFTSGLMTQMDMRETYNHPIPSTSTGTGTGTPPPRYRPISFGRGTQHLLNQDDIVPDRPRPSTSYFRSTAEDRDDSVSDHFSEISEADKIERLISRLEDLFANRSEYKSLLACRGTTAQRLLDMFHRLLDVMYDPPPRFERHLIVATQRLAAKSGLYPTCYELNENDVSITSGLGPVHTGDFADVYKADFRGRAICVKMLRLDRNTDSEYFLKIIAKETILWGQLRHPNVLPFYGIYRIKNRISFIVPWMDYGDITVFLKSHKDSNRVLLSFDVAQGLQFLHKNGIVHGDLKGTNILINELGRACLTDFGLSTIFDETKTKTQSQGIGIGIGIGMTFSASASEGMVRWQAPEFFDPESEDGRCNNTATEAGDVYAWGCVVYEIFAGQVPFAHLNRNTVIITKIINGERPARPTISCGEGEGEGYGLGLGLTDDMWELVRACWNADPVRRPTVGMVIERLEVGVGVGVGEGVGEGGGTRTLAPREFREMMRKGEEGELGVEVLERLVAL